MTYLSYREQRRLVPASSCCLQTEPAVDLRQDVGDTFETPVGPEGPNEAQAPEDVVASCCSLLTHTLTSALPEGSTWFPACLL